MTSVQQNSQVLIAGGGIGGLSAALALASQGICSHVLEADAEFTETGAGLQIGPNGSRLLRKWGLGDALDAEAGRPDSLIVGDGPSGQILCEIPFGQTSQERYGAPYYVAERALLHRLLLEEVRGNKNVTLTTDFPVLSFRDAGLGVAAMASDGREIEGMALIAADGAHSRLRLQLFGRQARPSGLKAWRSVTKPVPEGAAAKTNSVQLWLGPRAHIVKYCCGPDGPLNAVAVTQEDAAAQETASSDQTHQLKPHFAGWNETAYRVLQDFDGWMSRPLLEMEPLPRWSEGRITLLGDAAHPIMPFLASGAVMAIEDAAILSDELARTPDVPALAFRQYEARRRGRLARVKRGALQTGAIYHMHGPMRLARNIAMKVMPPLRLLSRNDWLYSYCAEPDERAAAA